MKRRTVLIVVGVLLALTFSGVGLAVYLYSKPHLNARNLAPDFRIDASALLVEFSRDEAAASRRFVDKIIEIKGMILSREDGDNSVNVLLDTGNPAATVNCNFRFSRHKKINMP
jgi:putative nucleic acid binding protein